MFVSFVVGKRFSNPVIGFKPIDHIVRGLRIRGTLINYSLINASTKMTIFRALTGFGYNKVFTIL